MGVPEAILLDVRAHCASTEDGEDDDERHGPRCHAVVTAAARSAASEEEQAAKVMLRIDVSTRFKRLRLIVNAAPALDFL